ncbi:MAG: carbamoyl-phosphate synthase large subunit, partial [Gammaproteobacteria bacterium]|nr:carbamoyl-phosphate synthase large subunit [Gammaproteobacteria bacterium]
MTDRPLFAKVLVANRGEIALRTVRALHDLGLPSVAVYADDDAASPHVQAASAAVALGATGPAAYLDGERLIAIAQAQSCDAVHPGYGFLSERADFARACDEAGLRFIGPTPAQLALFGDKAQARALAQQQGVPLMPGTQAAVSLEEAQAIFAQHAHAGIVIKAIGGGGGRGMRAVASADDLPAAYARCRSEAQAAFGVDGVYVERLMGNARHIEVQVLGDGREVMALGERECTLQRRFQKVVEIAPSPSLPGALRERITTAALSMARAVDYQGLGTFEFLVDLASNDLPFVFIECNPRLQVEHTITEEVTGVDLVQAQIALAAGRRLQDIGLDPAAPPTVSGFAIQWRINAETLDAQGNATPGSGTLSRFDLPTGPGVRVDTHGAAGATPSPHYDTLLAKLIVHTRSPRFADALRRSQRALAECRIDGVSTNLALLQALAARPEMESQLVHTRWLESVLPDLLITTKNIAGSPYPSSASGKNDSNFSMPTPEGALLAPMPARLVQLSVAEGDVVAAGAELAVLEAMKMEHVLLAPHAGRVGALLAVAGGYV